MGVVRQAEVVPERIAERRTRYLAHTEHLMVVAADFRDGPAAEPDPPHSHPHEQITYVASGEVLFFVDGVPHRLQSGDLITVPPDVPHTIQILTGYARLVDTFTPIRAEFLKEE